MRRVRSLLLILTVCMPACFASLIEDPEIADGLLTGNEYVSMGVLEGYEALLVTGGGAETIEARDNSYLEVKDTLKPLGYHSGIYDIFLYDNSKLLYLGGIADEITVGNNATAALKGGTINGITIYHLSSWSSKVTIYCQKGYQKNATGISGLWADGSSFDIDFINVGGVFSSYPTANFVNIVEVMPEPATLALLGLGGFLIRRKK